MLLVNLSQDKNPENTYFSYTLLKEIESNLQKKKKIILYLNKRGEYSSLICSSCQHLFTCKNCDTALKVHKYPQKLICHICNYSEEVAQKCTRCNYSSLIKIGAGTQQIESYLQNYFKDNEVNIFRFDTDVVKNKTEKAQALTHLKNADIIIGTKMITTGFDFRNIGLIGVILLEQELGIPAYNTKEKVYSNIKQLIGRGSRNGETTDIIMQTFIPENDIIQSIVGDNYKEFFKHTLAERKLFHYPPYSEMITLEYRDKSQQKALAFIQNLKNKLELSNVDKKVDIIANPNSFKKYNQFYYKIILKGENIRDFIQCIKPEIFRNSKLSVIFE